MHLKDGDNAKSGDVQDLGLSYSVIDVRDEADGGECSFLLLLHHPLILVHRNRNARSTRHLPAAFPFAALPILAAARAVTDDITGVTCGHHAGLGATMAPPA